MKAIGLLLMLLATPALAARSDHIQFGDNVAINEPVDGDVIAAGGDVEVNSEVGGDVLVFGGNVTLAGSAKHDVYVAGGDITIGGDVADDLRVAGGDVRIAKTARVGGDVGVAGGDVTLAGDVKGSVDVVGGHLQIDGHVGGDVEASGGDVSLGPDARIDGRLRYSSRRQLGTGADAQVAGGITRKPWRHGHEHWHHVGWVWTIGCAFLALLLLAIAPGYAARVTDTIHDDAVQSLLIGLVALVVIPILMALLAITVIGIPAAALLLVVYLFLLMAGRLFAAIAIGDIVLQRMRQGTLKESDRGPRMLAAIIAVVVIGVAAWVPIIGGLIGTVVTLLGLGAMLIQMRKRRAGTV